MAKSRKNKSARKKPRCKGGTPCGFTCIESGDKCRFKLNEQVSGALDQFASFLGLKKQQEPTNPDPDISDIPENKRIKEENFISQNQRLSFAKFQRAIADLENEENAAHMEIFRSIVNNNNLKGVFWGEEDRGTKPKKKMRELYKQLPQLEESGLSFKDAQVVLSPPHKSGGGYTHRAVDHVVAVTRGSQNNEFKPDMAKARKEVADAIKSADRFGMGDPEGGFKKGDKIPDERTIVDYLHEIGHQIHYGGGAPEFEGGTDVGVTRYSRTKPEEFAAEHFVAWLVAPNTLKEKNEDIFNYVRGFVADNLSPQDLNRIERDFDIELAL